MGSTVFRFRTDCLIFMCVLPIAYAQIHNDCKRNCELSTLEAYCAYCNLYYVPRNLSKKISALDLSTNYITALYNTDFSRHRSHLKYLDLNRNDILKVEPNVFQDLSKLHTLDISMIKCSLQEVQFPSSLRKLIMDRYKIGKYGIIRFPPNLEELSMKSCQLSEIPDFRDAPPYSLVKLDIRENPLATLDANKFKPFCRLEYLYMGTLYNKSCSGYSIRIWDIKVEMPSCVLPHHTDVVHEKFQYIPANDTERQNCLMKRIRSWGLNTGAAILIIVLFVLVIWCARRRSRRSRISIK